MDNNPKEDTARVVVIGIDGGSFDVLGPLIEKGRMPVLKKLIDNGVRGNLRTVIPPITPAARTLAWLEACVGQLFVAITIARLVSLYIAGGGESADAEKPSAQR